MKFPHYNRILYFIKDIPYQFRMKTQKLFRGYSDSDVWNTNDYLAEIIYKALVRFKKSKRMGYPSGLIEVGWDFSKDIPPGKEDEQVKLWEEILDRMIFAFDVARRDYHTIESQKMMYEVFADGVTKFVDCEDGNSKMVHTDKWDEAKYQEYVKVQADIFKRYEEGMALFAKYFGSLWD